MQPLLLIFTHGRDVLKGLEFGGLLSTRDRLLLNNFSCNLHWLTISNVLVNMKTIGYIEFRPSNRFVLLILTLLSCGSITRVAQSKRFKADSTVDIGVRSEKEVDVFDQFAQFLIKSSKNSDEFEKYSSDEVRRTVKKLAAGQETLKNMDGAAHQLRSSFSER